jgi:AraC-like DNA-binding protein
MNKYVTIAEAETNRHIFTYQKHNHRLQRTPRMKSEPTIAAGFAKAFLDFVVKKGADGRQLLDTAQLSADELNDADSHVPLASYMTLMETAIEICNEPALALQFGEAVRLQDISILGLVGHCETAAEAREQANRFGRLAVDDGGADASNGVEFIRDGRNVWLNFPGALYIENPLFTESALARCVCDGRAFAAMHPDKAWPPPKAVSFTHAEPSYRAEYDRIFRMPIRFSGNKNGILFGEELLSVRVAPPNKYVSRLVKRQAEGLLQQLDTSSSARRQVEDLLMPMLHTGEANIEAVARTLGVSRQTLFRKLKEEGVTFEKILDQLRHRLALRCLKRENISVNETAYRVGFSDPAAFSRAFKRWTGSSPRAVRKEARAVGSEQ